MTARVSPSQLTHVADALPSAVILVDRGGQVRFANVLAQQLIAGCGPLAVQDGRLVARTSCGEHLLRTIDALDRDASSWPAGDGLECSISRLPPDALDVFGHTRGCVVVRLSGPAIDSVARCWFVRSRFGATPAEAIVGDLVASGLSVAAIARRLRRSPSTIRTHLRSLFDKTRTTGQRQLAEVVSSGILPGGGR